MPGKRWAVDDQFEFLQSLLEEYVTIKRDTKKYGPFWTKLRDLWFARWPEHTVLYPGKNVNELTTDERQKVTLKMKERVEQLQTWFRWKTNASSKTAKGRGRQSSSLLNLTRKRTRALKPYEMYVKMHGEKVKPHLEEVEGMQEFTCGQRIAMTNRLGRQLLEKEDDGFKEGIRKEIELARVEMEDNDYENWTPEQFLSMVEDLPRVLAEALNILSDRTGWTFSVLMGGPHPMTETGEISVASIHCNAAHARDPEQNKDFEQSLGPEKFEATIGKPFTEFLEALYPLEIRKAVARPASSSSKDDDHAPSEPASSDSSDVPAPKAPPKARNRSGAKNCTNKQDTNPPEPSSQAPKAPPKAARKAKGRVENQAVHARVDDEDGQHDEVSTHRSTEQDLDEEAGAVERQRGDGVGENRAMDAKPLYTFPPESSWDQAVESFGRQSHQENGWAQSLPSNYQADYGFNQVQGNGWAHSQQNVPYQGTPKLFLDDGNCYDQQDDESLPFSNYNGYPSASQSLYQDNFFGGDGRLPTPWNFNDNTWNESTNNPLYLEDTSRLGNTSQLGVPSSSFVAFGSSTSQFAATSAVTPLWTESSALSPSFAQHNASSSIAGGSAPSTSIAHNASAQRLSPLSNNASDSMAGGSAPSASIPPNASDQHSETITGIRQSPPLIEPRIVLSNNTNLTGSSIANVTGTQQSIDTPAPGSTSSPNLTGSSIANVTGTQQSIDTPAPGSTSSPGAEGVRSSEPAGLQKDQQCNTGVLGSSRSGRVLKPSKHSDQMNNIDGKKCQAPLSSMEKENIPPDTPPAWFVLAKDNLLLHDHGKEWVDCIDLYDQLEKKLGYGFISGTRRPLPAKNTRPEEWGKFLAKGHGTSRNYDAQPEIKDSAEFGITFLKWWHDMQPEERKSPQDSMLPTAVYELPDSSWEPLLRAGSSRFVSILTQAVWWARALPGRSQWQDDTSKEWSAFVLDLKLSLQAMIKAAPTALQRKRKMHGGSVDKSDTGKRVRV